MNSFSIRKIPVPVEKNLRRIAKESHQSLNRTVLDLLAKATGTSPPGRKMRKQRDVSTVFGTWSAEDAAEFKKNTAIFGVIDEELWRK